MLILQICWYLVFPDGSSQHSPQFLPMTEVSGSVPGSCLAPLHWGAGYLHPVHPLAKDHSEEWWEMRRGLTTLGCIYQPSCLSFTFDIKNASKSQFNVENGLNHLQLLRLFWFPSVWCSSGSHISVLVWQMFGSRNKRVIPSFCASKSFFRWFFRHFQFCIAIPISFHGPSGFFMFLHFLSCMSELCIFDQFCFQKFIQCSLLLWWQDEAFSLQTSSPCLGCWFLNSIFMFMERNIMFVPHSSSSVQLMPLNCSTNILKPGIRNWKSDSNTYLNRLFYPI